MEVEVEARSQDTEEAWDLQKLEEFRKGTLLEWAEPADILFQPQGL